MHKEISDDISPGEQSPKNLLLSSWTKFTSVTFFVVSVILLMLSTFPFLIKRTEGFDSRLVSGAFPGSVQLLFFVTVLVLAVIFYLLGRYLLRFSKQIKLVELSGPGSPMLQPAVKSLKRYFVLLGLFTFIICFAAFIALLVGLTL